MSMIHKSQLSDSNMKYIISELDKAQWEALHGEEADLVMLDNSRQLGQDLEKNVDGCQQSIERVQSDISKFEVWCASGKYPQFIVEEFKTAINQAKTYISFTELLGDFFLIQMDVNTYTNQILTADNEWEWRAYARHFYTILYEHQNSVNCMLNDILKQALDVFGKDSAQYQNLKSEKKSFVKFINDNSEYAKSIRVTTDAHYDGIFVDRKKMIESMSYSKVVNLINYYLKKSTLLVKSIQPLIQEREKTLNESLKSVIAAMESYVNNRKDNGNNNLLAH